MSQPIKAVDLFAGTGWGVACKRLGIKEMGVEIMPEAVETRKANGMLTIYGDVWDGLLRPEQVPAIAAFLARGGTFAEAYELLIASPPCQTFSVAGHGAGRAALDEVIEAINMHAYKDPQALLDFGEKHDMRTALVLTPLAHVWRDRPRLVAFEQVPTVLPVWEACAEIMRDLGYSVKTAILNAEQYGVPQTRRRAILVARLDGEVQLPEPTHSRYYSNNPTKLDEGVPKWVSMAEALGWTEDEAEGSTFTQNNKLPHQAVRTLDQPAPTVTAGHDAGNRGFTDPDGQFFKATVEQVAALQSYPTAVAAAVADPRPDWTFNRPSTTIVGTFTPSVVSAPAGREKGGYSRQAQPGSVRVTPEQAAALQSYPMVGFPRLSDGKAEVIIDGTAYRARDLRPATDPAQTVTEKARSWKRFDADGSEHRITLEEAGALQSYEKPFVWAGSKTKQFLQIGNAVPPLLAQTVLAALVAPAVALTVAEPVTLDLADPLPIDFAA
jgi:DNA (cytosine-5)-methyltransferase 1